MKSYFYIYDVKTPQENVANGEKFEKVLFNSNSSFYFKFLAINATEKCDREHNLSLN